MKLLSLLKHSSLTGRLSLFLVIILGASTFIALYASKHLEKLSVSSQKIREAYLPYGQQLTRIQTELEVQLQEIENFISPLDPASPMNATIYGLFRLPSHIQRLLSQDEHIPSENLRKMHESWKLSVNSYQKLLLSKESTLGAAKRELQLLIEKSDILEKSLQRELSVELLILQSRIDEQKRIGQSTLLVILFISLFFVALMKSWVRPLEKLSNWLESDPQKRSELPPVDNYTLWGQPREIFNLLEALRYHIKNSQNSLSLIEERQQSVIESEKALHTLFTALQYLVKHNERLNEELLQKEKLASISETAAKLAHEIRNPLNSINLKLELLRDESPTQLHEKLDKIISEVDRLNSLTEGQLKSTKAHLANHELPVISLEKLIQETLDEVKIELEWRAIEYTILKDPHNCPIEADPTLLKTALINFIKNAWEAMEGSQRKIFQIYLKIKNDQWSLELCDTGKGFPKNFLENPWKSFRTTKHGGSGLGLSTSFDMLQKQNIDLQIKSPAGAFASKVILSGKIAHGQKTQNHIESPNGGH